MSLTQPMVWWEYDLTADAIVTWLEDIVPCGDCESLKEYLCRLSIQQLLLRIQIFEDTGQTETANCKCASLSSITVQPPPDAACRLHAEEWLFDLEKLSPEALQWIKNRLMEKDVENKMEVAWKQYLGRRTNLVWSICRAAFVSRALFPSKTDVFGCWTRETLFGPGPSLASTAGVVMRLKSRHSKTDNPGDNHWLLYLARPSVDVDTHSVPPLTPAVGVMVSEPSFLDTAAGELFASYAKYDVEVAAAETWKTAGFSTSACVKDSKWVKLEGIKGATVLFLGCCVIRDSKACAKLLKLRDAGEDILTDLTNRKLVGPLEPVHGACLRSLFEEALEVSTDWSFERVCQRLALWFTAWITRPKAEYLFHLPDLPAEEILKGALSLCNAWTRERNRLFAPKTVEGWEDAAELTAMAAWYGSAVGAVTMACLIKTEERVRKMDRTKRAADLMEEWLQNGLSIVGGVLLGAELSVEFAVSKRELLNLLNAKAKKKIQDDLTTLIDLLRHVRAVLRSAGRVYARHFDSATFNKVFQQAFCCAVTHHQVTAKDVVSFFSGSFASDELSSLRDGNVTHYYAQWGRFIFEDLTKLRVVDYSEADLRTNVRFRDCWSASATTPFPPSSPHSAALSAQSPSSALPAFPVLTQKTSATDIRTTPTVPALSALPSPPAAPGPPAVPARTAAPARPPSPSPPDAPSASPVPAAPVPHVSRPVVVPTPARNLPRAPAQPVARGWRICLRDPTTVLAIAILVLAAIVPYWWSAPAPFGPSSCTAISKECIVTYPSEIADGLFVSRGDVVKITGETSPGWRGVRIKSSGQPGVSL